MTTDAQVLRHEFRFRCTGCGRDVAGAQVTTTGPILAMVSEAASIYCSLCANNMPPPERLRVPPKLRD